MSIYFWPQMAVLVIQIILAVAHVRSGRFIGAQWAAAGALFALYLADVWGDHQWHWDGDDLILSAVMATAVLPPVIAQLVKRLTTHTKAARLDQSPPSKGP